MKILVIGHARHGKDTVCDMLVSKGYTFKATSDIYMDNIVWPLWQDQYASKAEALADKINRRPELFQIINTYNTPDKAKLAKLVLSQSDIYSGMRGRAEFEASFDLFDLIVWVDASKRIGKEDKRSQQLTASDAHVTLNNNGSEKALANQVKALMLKIEYLTQLTKGL